MAILVVGSDFLVYSLGMSAYPVEWENATIYEDMPGRCELALDEYDPSGLLRQYAEAADMDFRDPLVIARVKDVEAGGTANVDLELKRQEVVEWFTSTIDAGYDTGLGYRIKIDTEARNEFDALMTSINAELLSGTLPASLTQQYIFGIDETSTDGLDNGHVISGVQFIQLYAAGGGYYKQLLGLRKQYTAAIQSGFTDFTVGEPLPGE
ncbi:hypothetical protein [Bremerella sp. P1]|uniref:hypothetical protein n=1 Tax=Bremerella sp. P1 TaxID=3026424 RepID=UPI0023685746|nr:hypothetical protein [Bremerella sp. P1]WDI44769.1 hypothetical protein PSR63_12565 [Bremerella sp. P1]